MKAHPGLPERRDVVASRSCKLLTCFVHGDRRLGGAVSVVFPRDRRAPEGDHGIADELVDRAAMFQHRIAQEVEVAVQKRRKLLRRDRVAALRSDEPTSDLQSLMRTP